MKVRPGALGEFEVCTIYLAPQYAFTPQGKIERKKT